MLKFIENHMKNILLYWVSVLRSGGTGRMPGTPYQPGTDQRTPGYRTSRFNAVPGHRACPSVCNLGAFDMVRLVLRHRRFATRE